MPLTTGLLLIREITVTNALLVPTLGHQFPTFASLPPVFATAFMTAFVEATCAELVAPHLMPLQRTVGTRVDLTHTAATPPGMKVTAEVELVAIEGRKLRFKVACRDKAGPIGEGIHERAIIDTPKFMEKLEIKARSR